MSHSVIVDDMVGVTACACGMHVFARPGVSAVFGAFVAAHSEEVAA
jgi:hypothetical protein